MAEAKTMHLGVTSDQVGKYVFLPGSVERATLIANHFDNPVKIAHHREYLTYTGTLEGVPVTVTSTGIGGPSAGIAIEELYSCGAHTMMRIGSAASTSPKVKLGNVVIPNGAVRMEGTGNHYLPFEFPAVPDYEMLKALEEAANIDGASTWTTYWRVIFPMMKPMHATVAILTALGTWNDVMTPLVIMSGTGQNTLPLAQLNFQSQFGTNYNLAFASYILALIPILIFYVICQKQILNGVANGAVK